MKLTPQQQIQTHHRSKQLRKAFRKEDTADNETMMQNNWLKNNKIKKDNKCN